MSLDLTTLDTGTFLKALDLAADKSWLALGEHPLATLQAVRVTAEQQALPNDGIGRGKALHHLLEQAVAEILGDGDESTARAGQILQARLKGVHPKTAAPDIGLSVDRWYALQRDEAVPRLQSSLWELEQAAQQEQKGQYLARNLPPATYTRLFGVTDKKAQLIEALEDEEHHWLISVEGMGGIGKTALSHALASWAATEEDLFQDIAWVTAKQQHFTWQSLQRAERPALTYDRLLDEVAAQLGFSALGELPPEQKAAALKTHFNESPYLLVVDNLETALDFETLATELWELARPSKILLTTRHQLSGYEHLYAVPLHHLSEVDGLALMRYQAAERGLTVFEAASDADLHTIHEVCGGHPLAMQLVVSQVANLPLEQVLASLTSAGRDSESLYLYLYWHAWEALSDEARLLLVRLPLLPPDGGDWADLAAFTGYETEQLAAAIRELATYSLLQVSGGLSKRYTIHPLTRYFILSEIVQEPDDS